MRIDSHAYRRSTTASGHGQAIQAALVENYESLVPAMTNDPKDRHVLAAAVRSRAELIVTSNQKDFPATALKPYDVAVRSPGDFLLDQLDLNPSSVVRIAEEVAADMPNPKITWNGYLEGLACAGLSLFATELEKRTVGVG